MSEIFIHNTYYLVAENAMRKIVEEIKSKQLEIARVSELQVCHALSYNLQCLMHTFCAWSHTCTCMCITPSLSLSLCMLISLCTCINEKNKANILQT